jgi:hypothetical protein
MRVLIAVLALVGTPVIASVAQGQTSTPPASDRQNCANDHRWQLGNHLGDKNADKQCGSTSGTGGTGSTSGVGTISGLVFYDATRSGVWSVSAAGVTGWSIQLTGPVSQTTPVDFLGNFSFVGVPAGTYTVCQLQPSYFIQTLPANNGCYTVTLVAGGVVSNLYFGVAM